MTLFGGMRLMAIWHHQGSTKHDGRHSGNLVERGTLLEIHLKVFLKLLSQLK